MNPNLAQRSKQVLLTAALLLAATIIFSVPRAVAATSAQTTVSALQTRTLGLIQTELSAYATTEGGYSRGFWSSAAPGCWACTEGGPATAAATAFVLGGATNQTLLHEAEQTINTAIATRQTPDGGFTDPTAGGQPADIATMFFGVEFGTTYRLVSPYLTPATRVLWQNSLASAANYLVTNGDANWYSNGNINLGFAELFYLAWKATGRANLLQDYNNEWSFLVSPPQNKFPGAGLKIVKQPTVADGSDGNGYLAETGAGGTGFDPEYTMLQLDVAARLYLLSGDPRALRLANLEVNILKPRISSTMMLNTSGGTRHTQPHRQVGFQDSAAVVLSLFDGRDLAPLAVADLSAETNWFKWASQDNPVFRRALGDSLSVAALAEAMYKASPTITNSLASAPSTHPTAVTARQHAVATAKLAVEPPGHPTRRHRHS